MHKMVANMKGKNNMSKETKNGVGRPKAKILWPKGKFTFLALAILNGAVDANGEPLDNARVCTLTLRNALKRDMFRKDASGKLVPNPKSTIVQLEETAKSRNDKGMGRKPLLYIRRDVLAAAKKSKAAKKAKAKAAQVSVPVTDPNPTPTADATVATPTSASETVNA